MIIAFEGIDGSGKGTQSAALAGYLNERDTDNALFSFPVYGGTLFGGEVAKYLNGGYGDMASLPAEFPAMLYALDRFEMKNDIEAALKAGKVVIFDRYVPSNFVYQAAKLPEEARGAFIAWVKKMEYGLLGLPEPDCVFFLDVPPTVSRAMVLKKSVRAYTSQKEDIHERDGGYMEAVYGVYGKTAAQDGWRVINCVENGRLLPRDAVLASIIKGLPF